MRSQLQQKIKDQGLAAAALTAAVLSKTGVSCTLLGAFRRLAQAAGTHLDELHVSHDSLGSVSHGNAVACGDMWVGCVWIHLTCIHR